MVQDEYGTIGMNVSAGGNASGATGASLRNNAHGILGDSCNTVLIFECSTLVACADYCATNHKFNFLKQIRMAQQWSRKLVRVWKIHFLSMHC